MAVAVIVAAPGCSTKAADTNSAVGTISPEVTTSAAATTGVLGAAPPPGAVAGELPRSDAGFTPPRDCGSPDDTKESLWTDVKGKTPKDKGPNMKIVEVNGLGYALHNGNKVGESHRYNLLVIPTARVTGIECDDILSPKKVLNLWKYAWDEAREQFKSEDIMLGINSKDGRSHNQLHIHLTGLKNDIRKQLDTLTNVADVSQWNQKSSMYVLGAHAYRIAHVKALDTNPFNLLQDNVVKGSPDRFQQSMAVVADTKHGGFYLLTTQGTPKSGEPQHDPELKVGQGKKTYYGSKAIDDLMYLG